MKMKSANKVIYLGAITLTFDVALGASMFIIVHKANFVK